MVTRTMVRQLCKVAETLLDNPDVEEVSDGGLYTYNELKDVIQIHVNRYRELFPDSKAEDDEIILAYVEIFTYQDGERPWHEKPILKEIN